MTVLEHIKSTKSRKNQHAAICFGMVDDVKNNVTFLLLLCRSSCLRDFYARFSQIESTVSIYRVTWGRIAGPTRREDTLWGKR